MAVYGIRVAGQIDAQWSAWLDGLTITHPHPGEAMISGEIVDQAALHGTLNRIRNLNLPIISVVQIDPDPVGPERSSGHAESAYPTHTAEEGQSNVQHHPRT
ncbi:MAG TPA: hypothetical protein VIT42_08000 [Microlunatus sp.]